MAPVRDEETPLLPSARDEEPEVSCLSAREVARDARSASRVAVGCAILATVLLAAVGYGVGDAVTHPTPSTGAHTLALPKESLSYSHDDLATSALPSTSSAAAFTASYSYDFAPSTLPTTAISTSYGLSYSYDAAVDDATCAAKWGKCGGGIWTEPHGHTCCNDQILHVL